MVHRGDEIRIAGGGLAGLSLGLALARDGVPIRLFESGTYPRHKVCGEFIAGLSEETMRTLGVGALLKDAERHSGVSWFRKGRRFRQDRLPEPALGISRFRLDQRLATAFETSGGALMTGSACEDEESVESPLVWATGRSRARSDWIGMKMHCRDLRLHDHLEVHLGSEAYAGASLVEDGRVNVCALLKRRPGMLGGRRSNAFFDCLEACGLAELAERAREGDPDLSSQISVAGLAFGPAPGARRDRLSIGDAYALIPPFTGDGMAMAFEGAAIAYESVTAFVAGNLTWPEAVAETRTKLRKRFRKRLAAARSTHSFLFSPTEQRLFRAASFARALPFRLLFRLLH